MLLCLMMAILDGIYFIKVLTIKHMHAGTYMITYNDGLKTDK